MPSNHPLCRTTPLSASNLATPIGSGHHETYLKGNEIFEDWVAVVISGGAWLDFGMIGGSAWRFDGGGWVTEVSVGSCGG